MSTWLMTFHCWSTLLAETARRDPHFRKIPSMRNLRGACVGGGVGVTRYVLTGLGVRACVIGVGVRR